MREEKRDQGLRIMLNKFSWEDMKQTPDKSQRVAQRNGSCCSLVGLLTGARM